MNSQEAITLLRNLEDALDSYCELNKEGKTAFRMAITALEQSGCNYSESPNGWIPCSERLPSDHESYLLTKEVHYTTGRTIRRVIMAFYDDENDEWYEEQGEDVEVVSYPLAWMPLPEPYKGEGGQE